MAGKTANWKPGPTVCRCCLAEGCYKDISTEYFWMGKREVYAEMLTNTFNVSIAFSQSGGPNSNSRLICEPCISRLRDASNFKRQVLDCEKTFMQHLDPGSSLSHQDLPEELAGLDDAVKVERVKIERDAPSDDDFDATPDFLDDDDDELDQPLTNFATKEPKKEAVSLLEELLDNPAVTIKKKSVVKTKQPPAKKVKRTETAKPTSSKVVAKTATAEKKKKANYDPTRSNASTILRYTTACPFRVNDKSILCVYCYDIFDDPALFRAHMFKEHEKCSLKLVYHNLAKMESIKADLTELKCRICDQSFDDLDAVAQHLSQEHSMPIDAKGKMGIMPFKFTSGLFHCAVCGKICPTIFHLNRHTLTHFQSYVCQYCGSSYFATTGLLRHLRTKHQDYEVSCMRCKKKFPSMDAKEKHRRTEKSCMPYACSNCPERFIDWRARRKHMESKHGQTTKKSIRCSECNIEFAHDEAFYTHFKLQHSDNCAVCKYCGMKFVSVYKLNRHITKHNI